MTAKAIYLKPRSVICGLNEVKIVRHADLDSSDENTESSKKGDEQDKGKILEKLGVELTELTPEMKDISTIDWQEEQNADPSIRRVIALVQSGHKPTKRKISLEHEDVHAFLGISSGSPVKDHKTYVSNLEKRLKFAYKTAANVAEKASKRHKTRYDLKVRHSNLQKGDRVLLKKVGFKGKHKLQNKWDRDPYIIESQPDPSIPVYILKPEHGRSRKVTVHRNMILPIFSLPTEEIVREQSQSRSKKDKSPTRPSLELQKDDNVKRDENDQTLNEVSVNSEEDEDEDEDDDICVVVTRSPGIRDENRNASLVLNPRAPEFLPTSFGSSLPVSSVSSDFSSSRPLSITQSGYSGEVFSDTSGQTRISQSELNPSSSSTFRGASGSDNSRENSDTREQTDAQPVLRRTTRQSRVPQRYQDFVLYR
ncbi:Hypothetical predicted protein [Mytilus galloprovincialis]|uniref:Uncharacterized protein n=1 Tax=Mytilus galloprovincialis TaxID=29158 RepID=A0A8B6G1Z8_MYTGA|nr:Hypothetical predicted protein [Mytilus galloprovincialis]